MNQLTREDVHFLIKSKHANYISIYLPTEKVGKDILKGRIILKNLLKETEIKLTDLKITEQNIKSLLNSAYELLDDLTFWQNSSDGLALFIADDFFYYYKVPVKLEEKVYVSSAFNIIPLLLFLSKNIDFYLLTISQKIIRFYKCDEFNMDEIELENIPTSLEEALQSDSPERQFQFHTGGSSSSSATFHGHGGGFADSKAKITKFIKKVSDEIPSYISINGAPLVLAGVEYMVSIYNDTNKYPNLLAKYIEGSSENISLAELKSKALDIINTYVRKSFSEITEKYESLRNTENASEFISDIVVASKQGRISQLVISSNAESFGHFDEETQVVELSNIPKGNDEDLLNTAAVNTILNGGSVYVLAREELSIESSQFAIFRY